ncbi:hypothetical protein KIL84_004700 [Mauremys mutica]|uniref:Uncharacterized protein n=1 Tax=Mauremys mutica TaxID=74926 RepID=A0A9D4B6L4_9SAUR|nr:hypothetical protein KIL84_004700 [Mauremys mutica]
MPWLHCSTPLAQPGRNGVGLQRKQHPAVCYQISAVVQDLLMVRRGARGLRKARVLGGGRGRVMSNILFKCRITFYATCLSLLLMNWNFKKDFFHSRLYQ